MCVSLEMEDRYGFCFDKFRTDLSQGWDNTIQGFLLDNGVIVKDEGEFGRRFLDFLEEMDKLNLIEPTE